MRITNNIIQRNAISALQQNLQQVSKAQAQVSTGQRFQSFAEDPQAQSNVMQSSSALRALEQYRRNIGDATARANQEDSVLQQITTTLERAKEIAVGQGNATSSSANNASAKAEVDNLIDFVVGLGNTQYAGSYLFGGDNVTAAPVSNTPPFYTTPSAPSGTHTTEISAGQLFKSNHNAKELLLDSGVLQSLKTLSSALAAGNSTQIGASIATVDDAHANVQALIGDLGARQNQLEVTGSNLDALETNLKTFQSTLSEADQEQAVTELVSRQTAYQSAMLATSRVIGMTLTDYLK